MTSIQCHFPFLYLETQLRKLSNAKLWGSDFELQWASWNSPTSKLIDPFLSLSKALKTKWAYGLESTIYVKSNSSNSQFQQPWCSDLIYINICTSICILLYQLLDTQIVISMWFPLTTYVHTHSVFQWCGHHLSMSPGAGMQYVLRAFVVTHFDPCLYSLCR